MAGAFQDPPVRTEFPQDKTPKFFSWPWTQYFLAISDKLSIIITALNNAGILKDGKLP